MLKIQESINKKKPGTTKESATPANKDTLLHLAFHNAAQPNIISTPGSGEIITANRAACKLLGYSKKELLTKNMAAIFDKNESSFKKMLKQRNAEGQSAALVTVIKKSGKLLPCEITSAVFMENGIEKSITTIANMRQSILKQKNIDTKKEKIVADDIVVAKSKQKNIDTKKEKIVADDIVVAKSKQKNIDIKKEKIVADNIVLAQSRQKNIDTKKEKIVADNIVLAQSKQKNIDIKREKIVADNIVLAKSRQKNIDTKKEKIVAANIILAQAKSEARLVENNEWIKYIAKTSYDVMWDWDIVTGEIYVGDSIEEVFGYKVQNNTVNFKHFNKCLLAEEKDTVEKKLLETLASGSKSWNDSYMFKRHDGSVAFTTSRASIVRNEESKAIRLIGATQDVSRLQELEHKLEEKINVKDDDSEKFLLAAKISFDIIWDWKILTNEIFIGEGFEELFGYTIQNNKGNMADWDNYLHPDDKEAVKKGLHDAIASSAAYWQHAYRFIKADGSIAKVFDKGSIFRQADGKAYRMIGVMQDISRQNQNKVSGPGLMNDKKSLLIEKIKNIIVELVHYSDEQVQTNFSDYLSNKLQYDYTYLANLFSNVENIPIQKFIISQKIERAKELIVNDELTLTEIASKLHYSSVAHLSNQFKKVTGLKPSFFKQLHQKRHTALENV